jgi:formate-dependent phosphoribosylglycinamide formyltransferase (GAR transformylase)
VEFRAKRGMKKQISFTTSIYEICSKYPEVIQIMKELGFESIINPVMLNSVGRIMTISKGAVAKNIDIELIEKTFIEKGFSIKVSDGA